MKSSIFRNLAWSEKIDLLEGMVECKYTGKYNKLRLDLSNEQYECVWIVLRPFWLPRSISRIATACVYIPPSVSLRSRRYSRARENGKLEIPPAQKRHILSSAHRMVPPILMYFIYFNYLSNSRICTSANIRL